MMYGQLLLRYTIDIFLQQKKRIADTSMIKMYIYKQ